MAVANSTTNGRPKLFTRVVKGIGHWLGPETPTGKAFVYLEKGMSKTADKVGRSERFLDFAGGMLNRGLRTRAMWVAYQEQWLRAMRLPTWSELNQVRDELRLMRDQMEALNSQLEVAVEALEAQRPKKQPKAERAEAKTNGSA